jgi:cysteine desulfurase
MPRRIVKPVDVYLDHNASSPLRPEALRAMRRFLREPSGNPSSIHARGRHARAALDRARRDLAQLVGAEPDEIVFTSGGTESNNLGILGAARARGVGRVVTSNVEHPSVLEAVEMLAAEGFDTRLAAAGTDGLVPPDAVAAQLGDAPALVSIQLANHETGALHDVAEAFARARALGAVVHADAVQAFGRVPIDVRALGVDLLSMSGHKVGGPPGIGALFVRRGVRIRPLLAGGAQEAGLRPGTTPAVLAVGFAAAARAAEQQRDAVSARHARLREMLVTGLRRRAPFTILNGPDGRQLPNTLNMSFPGHSRESLLMNLDLAGVRVSAGAACASGSSTPSPVLEAMQLDEARVACAVRVSFGPRSSERDVDALLDALETSLPRARATSKFF